VQGVLDEAGRAIAAQGWSNDTNTQVVVVTGPSVPIDEGDGSWCAYHTAETIGSTTTLASLIPYFTGDFATCRVGDSLASATTRVTSHEYAETVTDPDVVPPSWCTSDCATNPDGITEIADLCFAAPSVPAFGYAVQELWSNAANGCVGSAPTPRPTRCQRLAAKGAAAEQALNASPPPTATRVKALQRQIASVQRQQQRAQCTTTTVSAERSTAT